MSNFKAGDKVYYPLGSTKVLTVYKYDIPCEYPIYVSEHNYNFTLDGKIYIEDARPSIYHATPEMKAKLEDLHGVEFEAPPAVPTSKDIIATMLERGDKLQNYQMENTMSNFKAGDKVYYPKRSRNVLTVCEEGLRLYSIHLQDHLQYRIGGFTRDGKTLIDDETPSIFHATPEMKAKLEDFYGVEFEAPPAKPTSKEIVKAYLDRGDKSVSCWVSNFSEHPSHDNFWAFVNDYSDGMEFPYEDTEGEQWKFATPFDHTTFQPITELPE